jgi:hypothetical protein
MFTSYEGNNCFIIRNYSDILIKKKIAKTTLKKYNSNNYTLHIFYYITRSTTGSVLKYKRRYKVNAHDKFLENAGFFSPVCLRNYDITIDMF